jgi:hypothetical protein
MKSGRCPVAASFLIIKKRRVIAGQNRIQLSHLVDLIPTTFITKCGTGRNTLYVYRQSLGLKTPLCSASYLDIKKQFYGRKTNLGLEFELDKDGVIESVEYCVHNHLLSNEVFIFEFKGNYDVFINTGIGHIASKYPTNI